MFQIVHKQTGKVFSHTFMERSHPTFDPHCIYNSFETFAQAQDVAEFLNDKFSLTPKFEARLSPRFAEPDLCIRPVDKDNPVFAANDVVVREELLVDDLTFCMYSWRARSVDPSGVSHQAFKLIRLRLRTGSREDG